MRLDTVALARVELWTWDWGRDAGLTGLALLVHTLLAGLAGLS